jgi:hypothetical protein
MLVTISGIPAFDGIKNSYRHPNKKGHVHMSLHYPQGLSLYKHDLFSSLVNFESKTVNFIYSGNFQHWLFMSPVQEVD